ncbi:MAG TPA: amidohydrolase family protein [Gaiellales bacterium]
MSDLLEGTSVVDVHCHGWRSDEVAAAPQHGFLDRITMLGMCLMSSGLEDESLREILELTTDTSPIAVAMADRLGAMLECPPTRAGLAEARTRVLADHRGYLRRLWSDAGVADLIMDDGYPLPKIDGRALGDEVGLRVHRVCRIEPIITDVRGAAGGYAELEDAFTAGLEEAVRDGSIAFKSVIAYRTGLDVAEWSRPELESAFAAWRGDGWRETREHGKPVRDALLRRALAVARGAGIPVHIHCGGGDPSIVLAHARPSDLFPLLSAHMDQPVVLIHSGWPWVDEGAFVASILPHVYLDTSLSTPWASLAIDSRLEILLGIAPPAKVMYGSDEASEPEVVWLSAHLAREALTRVLETGVQRRQLNRAAAQRIGADVLGGNARRLHGLEAAG